MRLTTVLLILLLLWGVNASASEQSPSLTEYHVKAAYLYKFLKYVEWPRGSPHHVDGVITICLLGDGPFISIIKKVLQGRVADGKPLRIKQVKDKDEIKQSCPMVFIGASMERKVESILISIRANGVLVVGETPHFASRGGIINFVIVDDQVRFEINPYAAKRAGLRISSDLLGIAMIVDDWGG